MRLLLVHRGRQGSLRLPDGVSFPSEDIDRMLDAHDVPDATPFLIDPQHGLNALEHVNLYLLDAARQAAYEPDNLRDHAYALRRMTTFIRDRRGAVADLASTTREELRAYKEHRRTTVSARTWNDEIGRIGSFLDYAVRAGWRDSDPTPRWGAAGRNTLKEREAVHRSERFLTDRQTRLFLSAGLRGDAPSPPQLAPSYPTRDHAMGLFMVSTGTRREETAYILDCEIPRAEHMAARGIHTFARIGKYSRPRDLWVAAPLVDQIDIYRDTERHRIVTKAQPRLRAALRAGRLLEIDSVTHNSRGMPELLIDGHKVAPMRLDDTKRRFAVTRRDDGTIEPLCLFIVEGGRGPSLRSINNLFADATNRLSTFEHADHAPSHLTITPHVLRHTFAVRMLAALMQVGRDRSGDPYQLLASPVLVVQQLLGHADLSTTLQYLYAAERHTLELPLAVQSTALAFASILPASRNQP